MLLQVLQALSLVYVSGPLLDTVQHAYLYMDSKHFVDMALKFSPEQTLKQFHELETTSGPLVTNPQVLTKFINDHFHPPGTELEPCSPDDWVPHPETFYRIKDFHYRRWALQLHGIWQELCRKVRDDVKINPERYSLLYVPHAFVIPGGRFREFYYWDSFWIMKGLLFSKMHKTARGVIQNLAYMVEKFGFVPNGGRVYYLNRSQPPLLTAMLYKYYMATGDIDLVREVLPSLKKEFAFWTHNRLTVINADEHNLKTNLNVFQYKVNIKYPRPESYREDIELVRDAPPEQKNQMYSDVAAAAESGWDFSTRWFSHDGPRAYSLKSIRTSQIVPVCLNAFMCMNARMMSSLAELTGDNEQAIFYQRQYQALKQAMRELHWNDTDGIWYDYDLERKTHVREYYISNALPLYTHCYDEEEVPKRVYAYLKRTGAFNSTRGIPTSFIASSQQWDSDNAWPPLMHMVIEALRTSGDPEIMDAAFRLASQWLKVNYRAYIQTHAMYEKYNVTEGHEFAGSGGEYEVQRGFGWTNGVILDLFSKYGDVLVAGTSQRPTSHLSLWLLEHPRIFYGIGFSCLLTTSVLSIATWRKRKID